MKRSILIIEDERDIRESLQEVLRDEGYCVSEAANGKEALDRLAHAAGPDLILLDLMMPVMNGVEFRERQRTDPRLSSIPVVIMSADNRISEKARDLGIEHFVKKPLDLDRLLHAIEQCCACGASPLTTVN